MANILPFEVPQQMRELADRNVEQGRAAYTQFMDAMMQGSSMWLGAMPVNGMNAGKKKNQPFEVPTQLRKLADRNVEQGRAACAQFIDAMAQASGMWLGAMPAEMASGFKVVQERGVRFAKQNADAGFALASELANAKDVQDALGIQTRYAQTQMQAYALQAQEIARLIAEASQSMQPKR